MKQDVNHLLTIASYWALTDLCNKLINKGANNFDESIEIAEKRNHKEIIELLKKEKYENES